MTEEEFGEKFGRWLSDSVGVPSKLIRSLDDDDDWTFIVKIQAIIEAGLNHLLITRMAEPKVGDAVSYLDASDQRKGKLAFIKAFGLLPPESCEFVKLFAELRNKVTHNIEHFDFNIEEHLKALSVEKRRNWRTALVSWITDQPASEELKDIAVRFPRIAMHNACMGIMLQCLFQRRTAERLGAYNKALVDAFETQAESAKSSPKE